jgi:hypothetical protein
MATPILDEAEVDSRMMLLAELQAAIEARGIRCVLARNHKLVLRYNEASPAPSGPTEPRLYIFVGAQRRDSATTDGTQPLSLSAQGGG